VGAKGASWESVRMAKPQFWHSVTSVVIVMGPAGVSCSTGRSMEIQGEDASQEGQEGQEGGLLATGTSSNLPSATYRGQTSQLAGSPCSHSGKGLIMLRFYCCNKKSRGQPPALNLPLL